LKVIRTVKNWPTYGADYLELLNREHITLTLRDGTKFRMRPGTSDRKIFNEVWIHRAYTPAGFEIGEADYVVDIGAHIGAFSILASKYAKRGMVYAFEPVPQNFEMLKQNACINKVTNIVPHDAAISDRSGERQLYLLSARNTGWNSFYTLGAGYQTAIAVRTLSLEKVVEERGIPRIDLLKMDCEGAEYDILFACPARVLKFIRRISLEYHDVGEGRNVISLERFLSRKGFEVEVRSDDFKILYARNLSI